MRNLYKRKKINFKKGDTIGGTVPVLLMKQIGGGWDNHITNRRGRKKNRAVGRFLYAIIIIALLVNFFIVGISMLDLPKEIINF